MADEDETAEREAPEQDAPQADAPAKTVEEMVREQGELLQEILKKVKDVRRRLPPARDKGGRGGGGKVKPGGAKAKKTPIRKPTMAGAQRGR